MSETMEVKLPQEVMAAERPVRVPIGASILYGTRETLEAAQRAIAEALKPKRQPDENWCSKCANEKSCAYWNEYSLKCRDFKFRDLLAQGPIGVGFSEAQATDVCQGLALLRKAGHWENKPYAEDVIVPALAAYRSQKGNNT